MIISQAEYSFLKDLNILQNINTKRILKLFAENNQKYIRRRLKLLVDNKYLKVNSAIANNEYIYSIDRNGLKYLGVKNNTFRSNIMYNLAYVDFYFSSKASKSFVKFNNHYYFMFNNRKYILNIDVLFRSNLWAFVEFDLDNRRLEDTLKKIQFYYESKAYKKLFDEFPIILIISNNLECSRLKVKKSVNNKNIIFQYESYNNFKNWNFHYSNIRRDIKKQEQKRD